MGKRIRRVLLLLVVLLIGAAVLRARRGPTIVPGSYLLLDIAGTYIEAPPQDLVGRLLRGRERALVDLLSTIR